MAEAGLFRPSPLQSWQRAHIVAAADCIREQIARVPDNARLLAAYEGLLDVLDPSRIVARRQREMASASREAAAAQNNERRGRERRTAADRRVVNLGSPDPGERRSGIDRRSGRERRHAR
jgi:hypothetical protein